MTDPGPPSPRLAFRALLPALLALDLRLSDALAAAVAASDPRARSGLEDSDLFRLPGAPRFTLPAGPLARAMTADAEGPFTRLASVFGLTPFECDLLLIALAPHVDARYGALYAQLLDTSGRSPPTVDLALDLLVADAEEKFIRRADLAPSAPLRRFGLIRLGGERPASALEEALRPHPTLLAHMLGQGPTDGETPETAAEATPRLPLDRPPTAGPTRIHLKGDCPDTLADAAAALSARLGKPLRRFSIRRTEGEPAKAAIADALLESTLAGAIAWFPGGAEPFDGTFRAALAGSPLLAVCDVVVTGAGDPGIDIAGDTRAFDAIAIAPPDAAERSTLWRGALDAARLRLDPDDTDALAQRFRLSARAIKAACASVGASSGSTGTPGSPAFPALLRAVKAGRANALAGSARRVSGAQTWDDLVLPDRQMAQLRDLCDQVAHRHTVEQTWGFADKLGRGMNICALFAGPSGVGKTMAAGILARGLHLDLYRIDLAQTVSKYIGETEKNLDRIFNQARAMDAVLFFDEADTLFGKRTEVKDAHDRYANLEVGYLLQKMEEYDGLAILATNLRSHIDEAFTRRLSAIVEFPFPDEAHRARIWRAVIPPRAPLADDVDFAVLARDVRLAGGNIRNIALAAAFLAARDGAPIGQAHLLAAARAEHEKIGRAWSSGGV